MRLVGVLPNSELAKTFGAYLQSLGISARVDEASASSWEIWVRDEDQIDRSRSELERFVANPRASEFLTKPDAKTKTANPYEPSQVTRVRFDSAAKEHHPIVTLGLILMCLVVAIAIPFDADDEYEKIRQYNLHDQMLFEPVYTTFLNQRTREPFSAIRAGEVWRLFTPAIMHGNWTHLIMNMMMLFTYGAVIEKRDGSLRMLLLCLFLAAFSNTAQYTLGVWWNRPFPSLFLGMSGVVFGLFGYAWIRTYYARANDAWDGLVSSQQVYFMIIYGLICITGIFGPVANGAHFGGMFAGMLWAWLGTMYRKNMNRKKVAL